MRVRVLAFVRSLYWLVNGLLYERGVIRPRPFSRPPRKSPPAAVLLAVLAAAPAAQEPDPGTELRREMAAETAAETRQRELEERWREVQTVRDAQRVAAVGGDGAAVLRGGQPLDDAQAAVIARQELQQEERRLQAARAAFIGRSP